MSKQSLLFRAVARVHICPTPTTRAISTRTPTTKCFNGNSFGNRCYAASFASSSAAVASAMEIKGYSQHSHSQYNVHHMTRDLLGSCVTRVLPNHMLNHSRLPMHVVDLATADGSNSMETLKFLKGTVDRHKKIEDEIDLKVTFEEQPSSDKEAILATLQKNHRWFNSNKIKYDILMKSFYEPLFPPKSVDLFVCYIALHWLDLRDADHDMGMVALKTLHQETDIVPPEFSSESTFCTIHDATTPPALFRHWRDLAQAHLANFFTLRAKELRPGGEITCVMVGRPFAWNRFNNVYDKETTSNSLMTHALNTCAERGEIRKETIQKLIFPFYLRSEAEIRDAFHSAVRGDMAANEEDKNAVSRMELVEVRTFSHNIGAGTSESHESGFEMFWSIFVGSLSVAGFTRNELKCIHSEAKRLHLTYFEAKDGIKCTYLACVLRRRNDL